MKTFIAGLLLGVVLGAVGLFVVLLCNDSVYVTFRQ